MPKEDAIQREILAMEKRRAVYSANRPFGVGHCPGFRIRHGERDELGQLSSKGLKNFLITPVTLFGRRGQLGMNSFY
jgi:hypothetical protein